MLRRSAGRLTAFGVIAAAISIAPSPASAASGQRNACYTATTFRAVGGPGACRGAEAFITWARHGLTRRGEVTGGTRPRNTITVKGDLGSKGPFISTRTVRGASGLPGLKGVQGDSGAQGPKGDPGAPGDTGDTGQQGSQGEQGLRGVSGETGPRGDTGASGAKGEQGIQGTSGLTGAQGVAGLAGPEGLTGAIGLSGPQGAEGPAGAQGVAGPQGVSGAAGAVGSQGIPGDIGSIGPIGPQGAQGSAGVITGFRRSAPVAIAVLTPPTPPTTVATVTPAAGAYFGAATTTITAISAAVANVTCTLTDGATKLGSVSVTVGGDAVPPTATAQLQVGVFIASGSALVYSCTSDTLGTATASGTLVAGLALDAIPESPLP